MVFLIQIKIWLYNIFIFVFCKLLLKKAAALNTTLATVWNWLILLFH